MQLDSGSSDFDEQLRERLHSHVHELASVIGPRHPGEPRTMDAAAAYIDRKLSDLGYPVARQTYTVDGCEVANLVAEQTGTGRPQQIVVVGAHYDTIPTTPGADDNASAVAMLIEVASMLRKVRTQRTIRFVAFACEEPPYYFGDAMGSRVYARSCRARGDQVHGMICFEMVGYYSSEPKSQQLPPGIPSFLRWVFPSRGDFLVSVGNLRSWRLVWTFRRGFRRAVRFPLFSIALPEAISEIRMSDNSSFWDEGYPALMITDTSFLRNPNYHMQTDTPETLDYARMARCAIGVAGGVETLALEERV